MRSTFSSSRLVRLLGGWSPAEPPDSGLDFAEQLSLWLNAFDAIGLQAAHQSIRGIRTAAPAARQGETQAGAQALDEDLQRVRAALAHAIAQDPQALPGVARGALEQPRTGAAADPDPAAWHQRHLHLQRQMEQLIGPLRDHVRQALSRRSPRLRQLAALDAVFEQMLAAREEAVLPTVATLTKRRLEQQRRAGREGGDPAWPQDAAREWRQALLAEVDLRLEPVAGLIAALRHEQSIP